jgi:hypothetical protein
MNDCIKLSSVARTGTELAYMLAVDMDLAANVIFTCNLIPLVTRRARRGHIESSAYRPVPT